MTVMAENCFQINELDENLEISCHVTENSTAKRDSFNLVNRHRTDGFDFDGLDISEKDYQQFLTNITYRNYELRTLLDK